jgi:hypothetical protein
MSIFGISIHKDHIAIFAKHQIESMYRLSMFPHPVCPIVPPRALGTHKLGIWGSRGFASSGIKTGRTVNNLHCNNFSNWRSSWRSNTIRMKFGNMSRLDSRIQNDQITIFATGHGDIFIVCRLKMFSKTIGQFVFFGAFWTTVGVSFSSVICQT